MPRNLGSLLREIARNGRQSQRLGPTKRLTREELERVLDLTHGRGITLRAGMPFSTGVRMARESRRAG